MFSLLYLYVGSNVLSLYINKYMHSEMCDVSGIGDRLMSEMS